MKEIGCKPFFVHLSLSFYGVYIFFLVENNFFYLNHRKEVILQIYIQNVQFYLLFFSGGHRLEFKDLIVNWLSFAKLIFLLVWFDVHDWESELVLYKKKCLIFGAWVKGFYSKLLNWLFIYRNDNFIDLMCSVESERGFAYEYGCCRFCVEKPLIAVKKGWREKQDQSFEFHVRIVLAVKNFKYAFIVS